MKKTLILMAMVILSAFFFTACGPMSVSNGNAAFVSGGNTAFASGGNVQPVATAGNVG